MKTIMTKRLMVMFSALMICVSLAESANAGWFQNATGVRTPDPIRKIAPNGLSYTPVHNASFFDDPVPNFTVRNNCHHTVEFHVKESSGWRRYLIAPHSSQEFYSPAEMTFRNGQGQWRKVIMRNRSYTFYQQGRAVEMRW